MRRMVEWLGCSALAGTILVAAGPAAADQVITDDLIVQGSLCTGLDCINGEAFSFDTIRLKENNTRIKFDDTSTSAGFAANDWQLTANEDGSGGANKFSIEDVTGAKIPFTIRAGAATNAIFVDSTGRVGFRTATPVLDLHVATSNTPGMRLEQNSSGGFTAQTWDIAGNEANFFVRDVTGGSRLPFRIRPGAPTSSLDIAASGNVGIGTASPNVQLHLRRPSGTGPLDMLRLENPGGNPQILLQNGTNNTWQVTAGLNYIVRLAGGANLMTLSTTGNLTIAGQLTTSGSCSVGCDRVFDASYDLPTIREHAEAMYASRHLPAVGPTVEGEPINISQKLEGMLNELEKAHIYIADLEQRLTDLEAPEN